MTFLHWPFPVFHNWVCNLCKCITRYTLSILPTSESQFNQLRTFQVFTSSGKEFITVHLETGSRLAKNPENQGQTEVKWTSSSDWSLHASFPPISAKVLGTSKYSETVATPHSLRAQGANARLFHLLPTPDHTSSLHLTLSKVIEAWS